jgi:hypothetical protein
LFFSSEAGASSNGAEVPFDGYQAGSNRASRPVQNSCDYLERLASHEIHEYPIVFLGPAADAALGKWWREFILTVHPTVEQGFCREGWQVQCRLALYQVRQPAQLLREA